MSTSQTKKQAKHTRRYLKTDDAIFLAIYEIVKNKPSTISVRVIDIVRAAGVHLSTFYRHFRTPDDVIMRYEKRVTQKYNYLQKKWVGKKLSVRQRAYQMLFFVRNNTDFFGLEFCRNNMQVMKKIFEMTGVAGYFGKFYEILREWAKMNFDINLVEKVLKEILN